MKFLFSLTTERLLINPLALADADFILQLLNTEGWLKFIGDRFIHSQSDATAYIYKALENPDIGFWIAKLKSTNEPIGMVSFITRDYLNHPDIGFAFLPQFGKKGYAYEAANAVFQTLKNEHWQSKILAMTLPENSNSINLLKKIGLEFKEELEREEEKIHLYETGEKG